MIKDLKDLKNLFKLCRVQGVTEIDLNGLKIKFGDIPMQQSQATNEQGEEVDNPWSSFPGGELTPTQLAYYSSGGLPQNDPELQGEDAI